MRTGMLWFDDQRDPDLETKIRRAVAYYEGKYGQRPTVCYLHPSTALGQQVAIAGLDVRTANSVLPHHFWLGRGSKEPAA